MCILLMGLYVIDDSKICYLVVLGYLSAVDEKTRVHSLNVSDTSEGVSDSVWHFPGTFWIVRSFHDVTILFDLACVWVDHRFNLTWLDCYSPHVGVPDCPLLSSLDNCHGWGFWDWNFERRCDFRHMVGHDITAFKFTHPCVVPMGLGDMGGAFFKLVRGACGWCLYHLG